MTKENMADTKPVQIITLKEFLRVFNYDNFGLKACKLIKDEFKVVLGEQLVKNRNIEASKKN